jgi:hypothetical protein
MAIDAPPGGWFRANGHCSRSANAQISTLDSGREWMSDGGHVTFDLVIVNDVFEHIFDTAGLLENLSSLMSKGRKLFFQVPNGLAPRFVISEGHRKGFGVRGYIPNAVSSTENPFFP